VVKYAKRVMAIVFTSRRDYPVLMIMLILQPDVHGPWVVA